MKRATAMQPLLHLTTISPTPNFSCSHCGLRLRVELVVNYCPNCGVAASRGNGKAEK